MPASIAQERLWKLQHALPDMPFFNVLYALRLTSSIDVAVLERSINEIVRRHEILRTTFAVVDGRHVQVIAPRLTVPLAFDDLRALPQSEEGDRRTPTHSRRSCFIPSTSRKGPCFGLAWCAWPSRSTSCSSAMHQVVCDGWSLGVFVDELAALYDAFSARKAIAPGAALDSVRGLCSLAAALAVTSGHRCAARILARAASRSAARDEACHAPGPGRTIDDLRTARRAWTLPASLAEAAKRFSHREGGTLFMALVAALKTLLHRYSGQDDVRVATNVANRNRPGTEGLIGPLVNTVILRTDLGGDPSPREVMRRVRATTSRSLRPPGSSFRRAR